MVVIVIVKGITVCHDCYTLFLILFPALRSEDLGVISTSLFSFQGPFQAP